MDWLKVSILCVITLLVKGGSVEQLPPIVKEPNGVGLVNPVLTETVTENNLHGHDNVNTPVIGQDDGHENVNKPLIGQDDGHENIKKSLIGQDDGHENIKEPLIGQDDGHENVNKPLLGKPDGHDLREHYRSEISHIVTFHPDDHEGSPDDHEGSGTGQKSKESGSDSEDEKEEQRGVEDYDNYDSHKEDTYNNYGEYYDEPLIRCKRPFFCTKYCDDYKTDETGCPICECLENPCEKLECRTGKTCKARECPSRINCKQLTAECVDERPVCAIPMCANYCEEYHYNERGCMTCDCAKSTKAPEQIYQCPEIECIGTVCATGYAKDEHGCTTCTCLDAPVTYPCAEPMCANQCKNGYKRNERGCMTCDCVEEDNCSECGSDEVCQHRMEGSKTVPFCAPKPLCLLVKEGGDRLAAMNAPNCESDGKFSPLQCKDDQSQCWCVDDRGRVIDGTSTSVYIDEHKPHCVRNRTVSATLRMRLVVIAGNVPGSDYPFTIPDLLESSLTDSLGRCLLMDRQYISVIKTQEMIGGDEAGVVTAASDIGDTVYVETRVRQDGYTDLPSAIEHMKSHIISNDCLVVVESGAVLKPLLDSLDVEYKFSHLPARQQFVTNPDSGLYWTEESWTQYCWSHSYLMVFAALLTGLVLISIILLAVIIARRRRMRMLNFQHQRLQSQLSTTSEKSFLDGRDDNVLLINSGPIEEKTIRA